MATWSSQLAVADARGCPREAGWACGLRASRARVRGVACAAAYVRAGCACDGAVRRLGLLASIDGGHEVRRGARGMRAVSCDVHAEARGCMARWCSHCARALMRRGGAVRLKFVGNVSLSVDSQGCVNCLSFSDDGGLLASGSDDTKIGVWRTAVPRQLVAIASGVRCARVILPHPQQRPGAARSTWGIFLRPSSSPTIMTSSHRAPRMVKCVRTA